MQLRAVSRILRPTPAPAGHHHHQAPSYIVMTIAGFPQTPIGVILPSTLMISVSMPAKMTTPTVVEVAYLSHSPSTALAPGTTQALALPRQDKPVVLVMVSDNRRTLLLPQLKMAVVRARILMGKLGRWIVI